MRKPLALAVAVSLLAPPTGAADLSFMAARPSPALMQPSRAAFATKPAKRASMPRIVSVWARGYLSDLSSVLNWVRSAPEPRIVLNRPQRMAPERPQAVFDGFTEYGLKAPPVPDRMLVVRDPDILGAAEGLSRALAIADLRPRLKRMAMPWTQAPGFKYRIVYLDSLGVTHGREGGFRVVRPGEPDLFVKAKVPAVLRRRAPVYFRGMTVPFEVEIAAEEDLEGLIVSVRQEEIDGRPLTPFSQLGTVNVKKGARAILRGSTQLLSTMNNGPVNFEHTHLLAGMENEDKLRVDASNAGLVDPPGGL